LSTTQVLAASTTQGEKETVAIPSARPSSAHFDRKIPFDIAAQDIASALIAFGEQADLSVLVEHRARGVTSTEVKGRFAPLDALAVLLANTGLDYRLTDNGIVVFQPIAQVLNVPVEAHAPVEKKTFFGVVGAMLGAVLAGGAASAEDAPGVTSGVEEIIVTAQKRAQSIMDVPLSVSAYGADTLDSLQVNDLADLVAVSPSLSVVQTTNPSAFNLVIRGQGPAAQDRGVEQSVGVFVDGVYRSRPAMAIQDLVAIERIEVIKGPQSSIFGRNNSAGAVSIVTREPEYVLGGQFDVGYSEFDTSSVRGSVTGPIVDDKVAYRLSGSYRKRDEGSVDNVSGSDSGMVDRQSARLQLLFDIDEDTALKLAADYSELEDNCCALIPNFYSDADLATLNFLGATLPGLSGGGRGTVNGVPGIFVDPFDRKIAQADEDVEKIDDWGVSADFSHDFGPVMFNAIAAYRKTESTVNFDFDATDALAFIAHPESTFEETQVELRLTSETGGAVDWLVGLYLYDQEATDVNNTSPFLIATKAVGDTTAYAAFGQIAYHVTDALTTTVGLRFNTEKKDYEYTGSNPIVSPLFVFPASLDVNDDAWMGDVSLSYEATERVHLYARYARGYKSPGANLIPTGALSLVEDLAFEPEKSDAYESGIKMAVTDRSRFTLAAFYQETKDQQVQVRGNLTLKVENAAEAEVRGVELEYAWEPVDRLTLMGGVTYLDSEWKDYRNASAEEIGATAPTQDLSGEPTLQAPDWAASALIEYRHPLGQMELVPRVDVNYMDSHFTTTSNDGVFENDATTVVNLSLELVASQHLSILAWGQNVTDEELILSGLGIAASSGAVFVNEPSAWGITVRGTF
jgi:iron complex outermembrane receptor protein